VHASYTQNAEQVWFQMQAPAQSSFMLTEAAYPPLPAPTGQPGRLRTVTAMISSSSLEGLPCRSQRLASRLARIHSRSSVRRPGFIQRAVIILYGSAATQLEPGNTRRRDVQREAPSRCPWRRSLPLASPCPVMDPARPPSEKPQRSEPLRKRSDLRGSCQKDVVNISGEIAVASATDSSFKLHMRPNSVYIPATLSHRIAVLELRELEILPT